MRRGVAVADRLVEAGGDHLSVLDHDGPHRNLGQRPGVVRLIEREPHERFVGVDRLRGLLRHLDLARQPRLPLRLALGVARLAGLGDRRSDFRGPDIVRRPGQPGGQGAAPVVAAEVRPANESGVDEPAPQLDVIRVQHGTRARQELLEHRVRAAFVEQFVRGKEQRRRGEHQFKVASILLLQRGQVHPLPDSQLSQPLQPACRRDGCLFCRHGDSLPTARRPAAPPPRRPRPENGDCLTVPRCRPMDGGGSIASLPPIRRKS